jgi:hypothetical protein
MIAANENARSGEADFVIPSPAMSRTANLSKLLLITVIPLAGCEKAEPTPKPEPAKSAPAPTATPSAPPVATAAPSAAPEPHHDCPEGSEGVGSFAKPCEAKGTARMMEVTWNGKMSDSGAPTFRVINKSKLVILYGKVVAYFYDKAGKQLDAPAGSSGKPRHHQDCPGNVFGGVVNPGEKIFINFSCVGKSSIPEGFAAIEAEVPMVGFADAEGKHTDFYWKNEELAPDERPKGGIKAAGKKK